MGLAMRDMLNVLGRRLAMSRVKAQACFAARAHSSSSEVDGPCVIALDLFPRGVTTECTYRLSDALSASCAKVALCWLYVCLVPADVQACGFELHAFSVSTLEGLKCSVSPATTLDLHPCSFGERVFHVHAHRRAHHVNE